jgi:DNA primase small subunit
MRSAERPSQCSRCQGTDTVQLHWSCAECLAATKDHISRLLKFLTDDFGVPEADIAVYFSGNRGYHLHVDDTRFEGMDPSARAEVAKYIRGTGLIRSHGSDDTTVVGWAERTAELAKDGQPRPEQVANAFGSRIDEAVTTDIHRIFRMPGTLHGNSGLLKMRVHDLQAFRPEQDPVVLGDEEVALYVRGSPKFSLKGRTFEPYSAEEADLPTYAAVYLMTKGLARLAE